MLRLPKFRVEYLIAGVVLAVLGLVIWQAYRHGAERAERKAAEQLRDVRLEKANAIAAADSTRLLYEDSLRAVERLAEQRELERDRLDSAVQWERKVRTELVANIVELRTTAKAETREDSAGTRSASFHVRQEPYTVDVDVTLPAPPAASTADVRVAIDTARMNVGVGCDSEAAFGVRTARVAVEGPPWLPIRIDQPVVAPDVCSPVPPPQLPSFGDKARSALTWAGIGSAVTLGAIVILGR